MLNHRPILAETNTAIAVVLTIDRLNTAFMIQVPAVEQEGLYDGILIFEFLQADYAEGVGADAKLQFFEGLSYLLDQHFPIHDDGAFEGGQMDVYFIVDVNHIALKLGEALCFLVVLLNPPTEVVKVVVLKYLDHKISKEDGDEIQVVAFELMIATQDIAQQGGKFI